jgi:hypothetical protein
LYISISHTHHPCLSPNIFLLCLYPYESCPHHNAGYCGGDNQGPGDGNNRKRKGVTNSVASIEPADTTLGISKKQLPIA